MIHAAVTCFTSFISLYCIVTDIDLNERSRLPMRGEREVLVVPEGEQQLHFLQRIWNWLFNFASKWWISMTVLPDVSCISVSGGLLQFMVRLIELAARLMCFHNGCKGNIFRYDFSIVPLV